MKPARTDIGQRIALAAIFSGVASSVFMKSIAATPPPEAITLRTLMAFLALLTVFLLRHGRHGSLGVRGFLRAALDAASGLCFALAIFEIPLSLLASIHATLPLVSAGLSAAFLGDRMRGATWLALALALGGSLLILKPALALSPLGLTLAVASTLLYGLRDVVTRKLPSQTDSFKIVLTSLALIGLSSAFLAQGTDWLIPPLGDVWLMVGAAVGFLAANFLIILALKQTAISLIAPLRYTALIWALVFDALLWGYVPDPVACTGIALIAGAGFLNFSTRKRPGST